MSLDISIKLSKNRLRKQALTPTATFLLPYRQQSGTTDEGQTISMLPKKPDFTPLSDVLKSEIARMGGPKVQHLLTLQKIWPSIVDANIAAHTHVSQYANNTLTITADHPAWLTELNLMKGEILASLRSRCPKIAVMDLRLNTSPK